MQKFAKAVVTEDQTLQQVRYMTGQWLSGSKALRDAYPAIKCPSEFAQRIEAVLRDELVNNLIWKNDIYQVAVRNKGGGLVHLSIKRIDRQPIHDWRDLQQIKNELVGPECEAVEIYPAESRRVDTANQYHLWAFVDPAYRIPFGFSERAVTQESIAGSVQRPFESQP
jgi:hypothetical protein